VKAVVYRAYGAPKVLNLEEVPNPTLKTDDHVLVKVHYSSMNPLDTFYRQGFLPIRPSNGLLKPSDPFLGIDVSGTVVEVGTAVSRFRVGDKVFGTGMNAHAEFVVAKQQRLYSIPDSVTFAQAAAVPLVGMTALDAVRDVAMVQSGQKVLVYGASGGIGHLALQIAKALGAHVTAVCSSPNLAWVSALGADLVLDYRKEDFAKTGIQYDFVYDTVGKRTYWSCKPALKADGVFIGENPFKARFNAFQMVWAKLSKDKHLRSHLLKPKTESLEFLAGLMASGKLHPHIEKVYSLEQIVEAHQHMETGHAKGKILLAVTPDKAL
jgi:NADPH:quinone reductase-like Zn-dependent oxidoreductase